MISDPSLVQTEVAALLLQNLNVEVPSVHEDLIETGLLDSLKIVELLVALEHRFDIRIPLQDLELASFRSVASIAGFVMRLKAAQEIPRAVATTPVGHPAGAPFAN
jgi:acyl carrier protein